MTSRLGFDRDAIASRLDIAVALAENPPDAATRRMIDEDAEFWGPRIDPGGLPFVLGEDAAGTFLTIAGQRIPAAVHGSTVEVGIPDRIGYCAAWAVVAVERLLRDHPDSRPVLVFGRSAGVAQQTWVEAEGQAWDLTLSERPFPLVGYLAGIHGRAGTSIEIPDARHLDALHAAIDAALWNGPRHQFIAALT
jgi:hypothetical protein